MLVDPLVCLRTLGCGGMVGAFGVFIRLAIVVLVVLVSFGVPIIGTVGRITSGGFLHKTGRNELGHIKNKNTRLTVSPALRLSPVFASDFSPFCD